VFELCYFGISQSPDCFSWSKNRERYGRLISKWLGGFSKWFFLRLRDFSIAGLLFLVQKSGSLWQAHFEMTWGFFEMTFFATSGFLNRRIASLRFKNRDPYGRLISKWLGGFSKWFFLRLWKSFRASGFKFESRLLQGLIFIRIFYRFGNKATRNLML